MASSIYGAALMEHNSHPDYKYQMESPSHVHEGVNPSCGDELTLSLRISDNTIEEAAFVGHGCAVSLASADMMADLMTGVSIHEAKRLIDLFFEMIKGKVLTEKEREDLADAAELKSISRMPARVKCAELSWRTLKQILDYETAAAACTEDEAKQ